MQQNSEVIFLIEVCQNCATHRWNTRHDEKKYNDFYERVTEEIKSKIPKSVCFKNQIPKNLAHHDIYSNLVQNNDVNLPYYQQLPRLGAFEVSYQGMLLFSKLKGGVWPNWDILSEKCEKVVRDAAAGKDLSQYQVGFSAPSRNMGSYASQSLLGTQRRAQSQISLKENSITLGVKPAAKSFKKHNTSVGSFEEVNLKNQKKTAENSQTNKEAPQIVQESSKKQKTIKGGPNLKKPEDITGMIEFPAGTTSLLSKYLTPEVFAKYYGKKDKAGVSFEQMILSGCQNTDSGIGCYAGSHDSYTTFSDLFDKIIEDYHKHAKNAKHISDMDYTKLNCPPFSEEESSHIVSTRIRVGRNLADFPLGPGISKEQRDKVEQLVSGALSKFTGELAGKYYALKSLSEQERKQLIDDHFLFKEGDRFLESCGLNRDWPSGRGIFHNNEKTFLTWVNEEDQLRIISMQPGSDILAVFTRLSKAATEIEKVAKFARDDHLGYITSCPTNLGTALRASVHVKLPKLSTQNKKLFNELADKYYVQIRGIHGEHTETDDGVFDISNKRRLGRSERDLVQDMYNGVKALIEAEISLQGKKDELQKTKKDEIQIPKKDELQKTKKDEIQIPKKDELQKPKEDELSKQNQTKVDDGQVQKEKVSKQVV